MNCSLGSKSLVVAKYKNSTMKRGVLYLVLDNGGDNSFQNGKSVVCLHPVNEQLIHFNGSCYPVTVYPNANSSNLIVEVYNGSVILQN